MTLTAKSVENFIAANPGCPLSGFASIEREFRFHSMPTLHALLDEMVRSGRITRTEQHGPGHLFAVRFAVANRLTFHGVMVAGARKANAKADFYNEVVEESQRNSGVGTVRLARREARAAKARSARVHAYVAERACR